MGTLDQGKREKLAETLYEKTNPNVSKDNFVWRFREELKDVNGSYTWIEAVGKWIEAGGPPRKDQVKSEIEHNSKNPRAIYEYLAKNVSVK